VKTVEGLYNNNLNGVQLERVYIFLQNRKKFVAVTDISLTLRDEYCNDENLVYFGDDRFAFVYQPSEVTQAQALAFAKESGAPGWS